MQADNFDFRAYLDRIGFEGEARADLATVEAMMRRQLRAVPFENLDVQAGKVVSLKPEDIVDKLVGRRRGGYCYEVNGLFAMALEALGVPYRFVAARPMIYPEARPRTHMALVVRVDGADWLCDLGFGAYGIRAPLRLEDGIEAVQDSERYQIVRPNEREYLLRAWGRDGWADQYRFDLAHQEWIDFTLANYFNSTHPDSLFVQKLLVMRQTDDGRIILFKGQLKTVKDGRTTARVVEADEVPSLLRDIFGLHAD